MSKPTPGPWTAERMAHGWHIGPQPAGVCSIHDNSTGCDFYEQEANARAIAALPDLLEALEWIVQPDIPIGSNAEFQERAIEVAREALAKAKGPQ